MIGYFLCHLFGFFDTYMVINMKSNKRSLLRILIGFTFRSTVLHLVTYMVIGALAFHFMTHQYDETAAGMQDLHGQHVMHWLFPAQILPRYSSRSRAVSLRRALLDLKRWGGLVVGMILFMFGSIIGINGAIEGWVYSTRFNLDQFLAHLPEVIIQTTLYGYLLLGWESRVEKSTKLDRHQARELRKWPCEQLPQSF